MNSDEIFEWIDNIPIEKLSEEFYINFGIKGLQFSLFKDVDAEYIDKPEDIRVQFNSQDLQDSNPFIQALFSWMNLNADTPVHHDLQNDIYYIEDYIYLSTEASFGNPDTKFVLFRYDDINGWMLHPINTLNII